MLIYLEKHFLKEAIKVKASSNAETLPTQINY